MKCSVKKCQKEINVEDLKNYNKRKSCCLICSKNTMSEDLMVLDCCLAKYCKECLRKEIDWQLHHFKILRKKTEDTLFFLSGKFEEPYFRRRHG